MCFLLFFPYSGNCICSLTSGWVERLLILLQVKVYTVTSTNMLKGVCILCHFRCNNLIKNLHKLSRPLHKFSFCHKSCQMVWLYTFCRTKMLLTTFLISKKKRHVILRRNWYKVSEAFSNPFKGNYFAKSVVLRNYVTRQEQTNH